MADTSSAALLLRPQFPVVAYCCRPDDHWTCLYVSADLRERFGVPLDRWLSDPLAWLEHVHPDDREHLVVDRLTAAAEQRGLSTEYRLRTEDGRYRWVHDEAELHWNGEADDAVMYGVISDITRRRHSDVILSELYEASRRQVASLQEKLEERDLIAMLLAHDVRSPLSVASAALETVSSGGDPSAAIERTQRALSNVRALIDGLVDLGRWSGEGVLRVERGSLVEVAQRALGDVDTASRRVAIDIPDVEAHLDILLVSRALANLVGNAVEHTPEDGGVQLRAYLQDRPRSIIFTVEDEGNGIPHSIRDDIFRPITTSRPSDTGARGLGLSLVQRMAVLHGGRVWFEDLPAGGFAFHLLIPQE